MCTRVCVILVSMFTQYIEETGSTFKENPS